MNARPGVGRWTGLAAIIGLLLAIPRVYAKPAFDRRLNTLADTYLSVVKERTYRPRLSPQGNRAWLNRLDKIDQRVDQIPASRLGQQAQVTRTILRNALHNDQAHIRKGWITEDINGMDSMAFAVRDAVTLRPRNGVRDWQWTIRTLERSATFTDQYAALLQKGIDAGRLQPRAVVRSAIEALTALTAKDRDNPLLGLGEELRRSMPKGPRRADLEARLNRAVQNAIPAHARLVKFLEEKYLPKAPARIGADRERYLHHLALHVGPGVSPEKLAARGQREVARLQRELLQTARQIDHSVTSLASFMHNFVRRDDQRFRTASQALAATDHELATSLRWARSMSAVPRNQIKAAPVPPSDAPTTAAQYWDTTPGKGEMQLNVTNLLGSQVRAELATLVTHEVGGHHVQQLYKDKMARRLPGMKKGRGRDAALPKFRADCQIACTAMDEGYALYVEQWRDDHKGFTPQERVGFLVDHLLRASRLVIDTGLHTGKLSRHEAVKYFMAATFYPRGMAEAEIERYLNWPGQAVAYYVGKDQLLRTRAEVKRLLGDRFDARKFHAKILSLGSVSPTVAHEVLVSWARRRAAQHTRAVR
jgi:uncharacterized protein (DUF885 family)